MTELPSGWVLTTVSEVTLPVSTVDAASSADRDIKYIDIGSIDNRRNRIAEPKELRLSAAPSRARQLVRTGDVLFATVRPYLRNIAQVPNALNGEIASTGFAVLRPASGIEPSYLYYKAISRDFVTALTGEQYGVSYPAVKDEQVLAQPFELPPTSEQQRIVAKIEELFSELDKGVESLTIAREQLKAYRQSILKHAFEGKLTQDWRTREPKCVGGPKKLEAALRACGAVDAKHAPQHDDLEGAASIPPQWAYFRVGSLCSVVRGGSPRPAGDPKYYGGSIPFLKVADLTHASGMHLSTHTSTIKEAGLAKTRMTPPNTLLISNSGATLGVPKICTFETTFNDGVAAFLGVPEGYLEYFYFFWESKTAQLRSIDQGAAQPNLNTFILGETLIPICSTDEARTLVELLKELLSTIERQSEEIDRSLAQAAVLRQAILKKAFSGQLVAQDQTDEPASVLLERIRAEREGSGTTKRRNHKNGKKVAA